jgi:polyketide synthase Type III
MGSLSPMNNRSQQCYALTRSNIPYKESVGFKTRNNLGLRAVWRRCRGTSSPRRKAGPLNVPIIQGIGRANPSQRFTQDETFQIAGYSSPRVLEIFRNCDIDYRHFYVEPGQRRDETPSELNERYLRGAMETGCHAVSACLQSAEVTPIDVDLLVVCSSTGYVCPDLGSRLIGHMGFRSDIKRTAIVGLGCAGALPALQSACDFVLGQPDRTALMLAVEICSACYFVDGTMDTVIGNAICADGAAAFIINANVPRTKFQPAVLDFESFIDTKQIDKVGFEHRDGKLRVVLANAVHDLAGPMIGRAVDGLLIRNGLRRADIRFWIMHPGGRKVIDAVQKQLRCTDEQVRFSRNVMRNFGNMSSPTVMFVADEVVRSGDPRPGDLAIMAALGPGMAAEAALLQW